MKVDLSKLKYDEQSGVNILIEHSSDYQIIFKLVKVKDMIITKIRRKDKLLKVPVFYALVQLFVESIEYLTDPEETIHIVGHILQSDNSNIKEGSKQSLWITDGCELILIKNKWEKEDIELLTKSNEKKTIEIEKKKIISDRNLQEKCFEMLQKYIAKKFYLVSYGNETIDALENGAIKVLFVTDDYIENQSEKIKKILSSETHKYHGANIVVYDKGTNNWNELTNYGGIIGVLRYDYLTQQQEQ